MFTLIEIGTVAMAIVFLVLGLVALLRCDRAAIPDTVRALSSWLRYSYGPISWPTDRHEAPVRTEDVHPEATPHRRQARSLDQS